MNWQPIYTTPKDGTTIIVYHDEDEVCTARWCAPWSDGDFYWHDLITRVEPSHWMPMPKRPEEFD